MALNRAPGEQQAASGSAPASSAAAAGRKAAESRTVKVFRFLGAVACGGLALASIVGLARDSFTDVWMLTAFGGLGAVLAMAVGVCRREFIELFVSPRFRVAVNVLVQAGIGTAVLGCFLYLFGGRIYKRWDLAAERAFRLSEETLRTLEQLRPKNVPPVEAVYLQGEIRFDHPRRRLLLKRRERVLKLLKEYQLQAESKAPGKFTFRVVEMQREPEKLRKLAVRTKIGAFSLAEVDGVLLLSGDRYRLIRAGEMYGRGVYGSRKVTRVVFQGERVVTSQLRILLKPKGERPTIYFTVGHKERTPNGSGEGIAAFQRRLRANNFEVKPLDFRNAVDVPRNAKAVVICGPRTAFQPEETARLQEYLARKDLRPALLILLDPLLPASPGEALEPSGLEPLLRAYAVRVRQNYLARAYRPTFLGNPEPETDCPVYATDKEPFLRPLRTRGRGPVLLRRPCVLEADNKSSLKLRGYFAEPLLRTTAYEKSRYLRTWADPVDRDAPRAAPGKDSLKGPLTAALLGSRRDPLKTSKEGALVLVVADSNLASNRLFNSIRENRIFLENAIRRLVGREELLGAIPPNEMELRTAKVKPEERRLLWVLLSLGIPIAFVFLGVVVWAGRRT